MDPKVESRFWGKVDRRGPDECWPWTKATTRGGYGHMNVDGRNIRSNRLALMVAGVDVKPDADVLHSCDNPPCCNARHLRLGTAFDNVQDAIARGRCRSGRSFGERNGNAKLTQGAVAAIRQDMRPVRVIAAEYKISKSLVSYVRRGDIWK